MGDVSELDALPPQLGREKGDAEAPGTPKPLSPPRTDEKSPSPLPMRRLTSAVLLPPPSLARSLLMPPCDTVDPKASSMYGGSPVVKLPTLSIEACVSINGPEIRITGGGQRGALKKLGTRTWRTIQ